MLIKKKSNGTVTARLPAAANPASRTTKHTPEPRIPPTAPLFSVPTSPTSPGATASTTCYSVISTFQAPTSITNLPAV